MIYHWGANVAGKLFLFRISLPKHTKYKVHTHTRAKLRTFALSEGLGSQRSVCYLSSRPKTWVIVDLHTVCLTWWRGKEQSICQLVIRWAFKETNVEVLKKESVNRYTTWALWGSPRPQTRARPPRLWSVARWVAETRLIRAVNNQLCGYWRNTVKTSSEE